jgi:hypothetical protein
VCALFNEFEMARAGIKCAVVKKIEIERKLKAIVDDPKRRYALWSLSRYYGYIRNPDGVTEDFVLSGTYELDVARERISCKVSLSPLYDPDMARIKA